MKYARIDLTRKIQVCPPKIIDYYSRYLSAVYRQKQININIMHFTVFKYLRFIGIFFFFFFFFTVFVCFELNVVL